jgi:hypothetical protein
MNSHYDAYMCRKERSQCSVDAWFPRWLSGMTDDEIKDRMWGAFAKRVAKDGFLKFDSNGKLVRGEK